MYSKQFNMSDSKLILVTGGSGLVGRALAYVVEKEQNNADEKWIFVSSKDADLCDAKQTKDLFEKYKPTHVIHLAAAIGGSLRLMKCNLELFRTNMRINSNVLERCKKSGVRKVISCSSANIFPRDASYPITEEMIHLGPPNELHYGYSYAKRMIDVLNKGFSQSGSTLFTAVIPPNIYGPYDNFNIEDANALPAFIHKAYRAKRVNTDFVVSGSGKQRRQFIYSRDLASLIIWVLREYQETEPLILSVDEENEVSIKEAAEAVSETFGLKKQIVFDCSKPDNISRKTLSTGKLRRYLPNFTFTELKQGIKETCDWFVENLESVRK